MNQNETPLFDALIQYKNQVRYSFHVPGHKNGYAFPTRGNSEFRSLLAIDATEVEGLDDLFHPKEAIKEAQDLLRAFYNTKHSYFLINGTTSGNLSMILATCKRGEDVFVQRNSHKSIFNGLALAGAHPILLRPELDSETNLPYGLSEETLLKAIRRHPEVKVLILTYPNYYGMAGDYEPLIKLAKAHHLLVLVDEAHGAHFGVGDPIPRSTLSMGADVVVQSAHKTLPAMTMGSYLHINSDSVSHRDVEAMLAMVQTSSPSYPIMASLDLARCSLAILSQSALNKRLDEIHEFVQELKTIPQIKVMDQPSIEGITLDPFKVLLQTRCELTGIECQEALREAGIYIELADRDHMLLILPVIQSQDLQKSAVIFKNVLSKYSVGSRKSLPQLKLALPAVSTLSVNIEEQVGLKVLSLPLEKTVGRVAAKDVIPYPPGIPLVLKGEIISSELIEVIEQLMRYGIKFQGLDLYNHKMLEIFDYTTDKGVE